MDLKDIMRKKNFAVLGDTTNPDKYAYRIKEELLAKGYTVHAVGKELPSLNDIDDEIEIEDVVVGTSVPYNYDKSRF